MAHADGCEGGVVSNGVCLACGEHAEAPKRPKRKPLNELLSDYAQANGDVQRSVAARHDAEAAETAAEARLDAAKLAIAHAMRKNNEDLLVVRRGDGTNVVLRRDTDRVTVTIVETATTIDW